MAQKIIKIGGAPGDTTPATNENIYSGFDKANQNFTELYDFIPTLLAKAGGIMAGVLQFANGTANAPGAKIGSDQKGLYHVDTDKLGVSVGGSKVGEFNSKGYAGLTNRLVLQYRLPSGNAGGLAVALSWNQRNINTEILNDITGASLGTNQFTLPPGRYYIKNISAVAFAVGGHQIRLFNVTSNSTQADINSNQIVGSTEYSLILNPTSSSSCIRGYYFDVLTNPKVFRIEHYVSGTAGASDFGQQLGASDEVYLTIEIEKVG